MRYMTRKFEPDFLSLFETHIGPLSNFVRVEARGQSDGIWLLWQARSCDLHIVSQDDQFIHATVNDGVEVFHLFAVYGCPFVQRHDRLSAELRSATGAGVLGGDFNVILSLAGRLGGLGDLHSDSQLGPPRTTYRYRETISSDHNPFLLSFMGRHRRNPHRCPFRIQAAWLTHPSFKDVLEHKWKDNVDLSIALKILQDELVS
ncbi:LOW QUALITY PROTEIN: hypothetical protein V2J09_022357 [Rumex salicifolius]